VKVNLEGDVQVSDDTIHGLGTAQTFLRTFFGSLFLVAKTPPLSPHPSEYTDMSEMAASPAGPLPAVSQTLPPRPVDLNPVALIVEAQEGAVESFKTVLIACVPNPGYFVAGGLAGIVSRTSTAPLDRLKVYLIAQTSVARDAVALAKSGNVFLALANSWRPLVDATKELWKAGGMRSLYAGRSLHMPMTTRHH
jgi:solute carrier family 25 phosphate transporter 23/24/25/41